MVVGGCYRSTGVGIDFGFSSWVHQEDKSTVMVVSGYYPGLVCKLGFPRDRMGSPKCSKGFCKRFRANLLGVSIIPQGLIVYSSLSLLSLSCPCLESRWTPAVGYPSIPWAQRWNPCG